MQKTHITIYFETEKELNDMVANVLFWNYKTDVPSANRDYYVMNDSFSNRINIYNNNEKMWEIVNKISEYKVLNKI